MGKDGDDLNMVWMVAALNDVYTKCSLISEHIGLFQHWYFDELSNNVKKRQYSYLNYV